MPPSFPVHIRHKAPTCDENGDEKAGQDQFENVG
jgi:hypothetical protein